MVEHDRSYSMECFIGSKQSIANHFARPLRVIYIDSPRIVVTNVANFQSIVQKLTGKNSSIPLRGSHFKHVQRGIHNTRRTIEDSNYGSSHDFTKTNYLRHKEDVLEGGDTSHNSSSTCSNTTLVCTSQSSFVQSEHLTSSFESSCDLESPCSRFPFYQGNICDPKSPCSHEGQCFNFISLFSQSTSNTNSLHSHIMINPNPTELQANFCDKKSLANEHDCFMAHINEELITNSFCNIQEKSFSEQDIIAGLFSIEPLPDVPMLPPLMEDIDIHE